MSPADKKTDVKKVKKAPQTLSRRLVQTGRVAYIAFGRETGKLCTIVEIVDHNRALVDGPNVTRQLIRYKALHLTKFVIHKLPRGSSTRAVRKLWAAAKIDEKWNATSWAKRLAAKHRRATLTDFERFKLMKAKQMRNRLLKVEVAKLKKVARKSADKGKKKPAAKGAAKGAAKPAVKAAAPPKAAVPAAGAKKK